MEQFEKRETVLLEGVRMEVGLSIENRMEFLLFYKYVSLLLAGISRL